jgi:outer membrane receptor protein involved in Fe transport
VTGFRNSGRTEAYGAEISGDVRWTDSLRTFASYSFQSAHGPFQQSTPRHKASGGIRGDLGSRLRYALTGYYVAAHDIETSSAVTLADDHVRSRFTVDGFLGIRLHPRFELGLHAQNLFHQKRRQFPQGDEIGTELLLTGTVEF